MRNCSISGNTGARGGGISTYCGGSSSLVVSNCTIISNTATMYAGGLRLVYNTYVYNSTIQYNYSSGSVGAGGIYVTDNSSFYSCLIANNRAGAGSGGGIVAAMRGSNTPAVLYNCTISSNQSKAYGGIYLTFSATALTNGSFLTYNTIAWGNTSTGAYLNGTNVYVATASTGQFYNCDIEGGTNFYGSTWSVVTNCISADPQMIDLPGGNYRLARGSPCINTGLNQDWMTNSFDRDGHARIDHFRRQVDMGAYEYLSHGTLLSGH